MVSVGLGVGGGSIHRTETQNINRYIYIQE